MTSIKVAALMFLICAGILIPAVLQRQSQKALLAENEALRQQAEQALRLSMENRRLSNSLAESKRLGVEVKGQLQELIKLRAEMKRLQLLNSGSNVIGRLSTNESSGDMVGLRAEIGQLRQHNQELEVLLAQLRQLQADVASAEPAETPATNSPPQLEEQPLTVRLIRTQGDAFAEKLKRSVSAKEDETFEEVFARFLQINGVPTSSVAAAAYDPRTGRVILRATPAALDQIESLTTALDRAP